MIERIVVGEVDRMQEIAEGRRPQDIMKRLFVIDQRIKDGEDPITIEIGRDLFAQTINGERAFRRISGGTPCERKDFDSGKICGNRSILVIDFDDASRDHEQKSICTTDHIDEFDKVVNMHLEVAGSSATIVGINGWGRA